MEMKLEVSDAALMELARGSRNAQQIENPLAKEILSGRFGPKDIIHVDVAEGRIVFELEMEAEVV
jgi:ATP-dependent Clp protease ATP-binding subunit ClpB